VALAEWSMGKAGGQAGGCGTVTYLCHRCLSDQAACSGNTSGRCVRLNAGASESDWRLTQLIEIEFTLDGARTGAQRIPRGRH
jgi:hypothetical protein